MKALLATLMIALSVTFAGCSSDDADDAATEEPAAEDAAE